MVPCFRNGMEPAGCSAENDAMRGDAPLAPPFSGGQVSTHFALRQEGAPLSVFCTSFYAAWLEFQATSPGATVAFSAISKG